MHSWNTIKAVSTNKLDQATAVLEALHHPANASILEYLRENRKAQLLDLALYVQTSAQQLELQLERLCRCKLVLRREDIVGCHYTLNEAKLREAQRVAEMLSGLYQEGH